MIILAAASYWIGLIISPNRERTETMTFREALEKLGIQDFEERIFNSNSHGELFHLAQYGQLAEVLEEKDLELFRAWFLRLVASAEAKWNRPESIFQYVLVFFVDAVKPAN